MCFSIKLAEIAKSIGLALCPKKNEPIPMKSAVDIIAKNGEESQKGGISISLILTSLRNLLGYLKGLTEVFKSTTVNETSPLMKETRTKNEVNLDKAIECLAQQQKNALDPNFPLSRDVGPFIREVIRCSIRCKTTLPALEDKLKTGKVDMSDAAVQRLLEEFKAQN